MKTLRTSPILCGPSRRASDAELSLFGVPDFFDRNKISSGGDLSHYQVPHCIRVFFYFVWFVFIHHNIHFYFELCTYCNILDIYLSWNMNSVKYLFYMELLNYLFCAMFGGILECYELTHVLPYPDPTRQSCMSGQALLPHWLSKAPMGHM